VSALVGIFVGGASRRMGGRPKGLLPSRDGRETLVARLVRLSAQALDATPIVLVGAAEPYGDLALAALPDDPPGVGPIGGLRALLANARARGFRSALALSCDLPDVTAALIERLARHAEHAAAVAPQIGGVWQPLFARYDADKALDAVELCLGTRRHALQDVLEVVERELTPLPLEPGEAELLGDWDEPKDISSR
jgi:molybdopterin-guanine dinucleotide biosynthesis protein A